MRADVRRTLVAYDIPDDARRTRLAKKLESYGDRVQYSVFVIDVGSVKRARLRADVDRIIVPDLDSVLIADLGPVAEAAARRFVYVGRTRTITGSDSFIL